MFASNKLVSHQVQSTLQWLRDANHQISGTHHPTACETHILQYPDNYQLCLWDQMKKRTFKRTNA